MHQQSSDKIHFSNLVNLSGVRDNIKYNVRKGGKYAYSLNFWNELSWVMVWC